MEYCIITEKVKSKLFHSIERKFRNVSSCKENNQNLFFRHKALAAPSIDKTKKQVLLKVISLKFVSKSRQILEKPTLHSSVNCKAMKSSYL